jgi:predicted PurR-regulated permease PerM
MPKRGIYNAFFFIFLIAVLWGILKILEPFAGALLSAVVIAITFYPFYEQTARWMPKRSDTLRSLLTVLGILIFFVGPLVLFGWILSLESESFGTLVKGWGDAMARWRGGHLLDSVTLFRPFRAWLGQTFGISLYQLEQALFGRIGQSLGMLTRASAEMAQNIIIFLFQLLLMMFTLFFLFRDGKRYKKRLEALFPMPAADTREVLGTVHDTIVGVVRGWLLTSIVQGVCATIGYLIVGLPGAVLAGMVTALIGLLPVVGTFGVWIPIGLFLLAKGMIWQGIFVLIWGALVVVSFIDTIVRPYLVGQRAEMPLLFLLFALLGGVEVFGAKGIIVGPILIAMAPLLFDIYRRRYLLEDAS